ncbi:MAG: CoA transferase subunit A [Bacteroidales bacterium]|jgi:acetate CoA/acetoacetate CoA-transferase alpha subunit|nr:CoA transferase subunit A [Bacteroidales bacterium]
MSKKILINEAADMVKDGMTLMIGGFLAVGSANKIIEKIADKGVKDLTVICNDASYPDKGIGLLIAKGCVKKCIASYIGSNPIAGDMMNSGEIEMELVPQGTLAERVRCGGVGLGGFLTKTGIGTLVEQGKQKIKVNDEEFLLELPLHADVALIGASLCDKHGNIIYNGTSQNFNPLMAMAADVVIAEVKDEVEEMKSETIHTPFMFVDYIVKA